MKVEAKITPEWRKRMILIIAFILGASGWFFYDGFVGYPKKIERHASYQVFLEEMIASGTITDASDVPFRNAWNEEAVRRGWKREVPKAVTDGAIREQKIIGTIAALVGFGFLTWFFISSKRTLRADEETIFSAEGEDVKFDWIDSIDDKKWKSKGIVYAYYNEAGAPHGKRKKLTLDDYKYGGAIEIIKHISKKLGRELQT